MSIWVVLICVVALWKCNIPQFSELKYMSHVSDWQRNIRSKLTRFCSSVDATTWSCDWEELTFSGLDFSSPSFVAFLASFCGKERCSSNKTNKKKWIHFWSYGSLFSCLLLYCVSCSFFIGLVQWPKVLISQEVGSFLFLVPWTDFLKDQRLSSKRVKHLQGLVIQASLKMIQ